MAAALLSHCGCCAPAAAAHCSTRQRSVGSSHDSTPSCEGLDHLLRVAVEVPLGGDATAIANSHREWDVEARDACPAVCGCCRRIRRRGFLHSAHGVLRVSNAHGVLRGPLDAHRPEAPAAQARSRALLATALALHLALALPLALALALALEAELRLALGLALARESALRPVQRLALALALAIALGNALPLAFVLVPVLALALESAL